MHNTMKRIVLTSAMMWLALAVLAADGKYQYTIDLARVVDDKVYVELRVPEVKAEEVVFHMPAMIPGTYAIEDYGRFVSELQAFDKKGHSLKVERQGTNAWKILKPKKLAKITYWVEDSYDTELDGPEIFQPAGTNIEAGKNFILNASGYFGYLNELTTLPYEVQVIKPAGFYGSTGMQAVSIDNPFSAGQYDTTVAMDVFATATYDELVDSPILYCRPDTTRIKVAETEVLVSVYSPNKVVNSLQIATSISDVLMAQRDYLGGHLPVDKYAFLFYYTDQPVMSYGALEHSYSSFYYMPEEPIEVMEEQLRDFAAHEFFHIVTPLTIHSDKIVPFDFTHPTMSRHLWLYEGMTEYFAGNALVKGGLMSIDQYMNVLREKMMIASQFIDTIPMTELSLGALDKYKDQYYNFYQKGALIGMALDITLLDLSDGTYDNMALMKDLGKRFGKHRSFKDEELFDIIEELTYPEVRTFLDRYVGGPEPLPYADIFLKAGIIYEEMGTFYDYSLGLTSESIDLDMATNRLYIADTAALDDFGRSLGLQNGDIIIALAGKPMPEVGPKVQRYIQEIYENMREGEEYTITVLRKEDNGEEKEVVLKAPIVKVKRVAPFSLRPLDNPTDKQLRVLGAWLGIG